jgi:hypothetical protein
MESRGSLYQDKMSSLYGSLNGGYSNTNGDLSLSADSVISPNSTSPVSPNGDTDSARKRTDSKHRAHNPSPLSAAIAPEGHSADITDLAVQMSRKSIVADQKADGAGFASSTPQIQVENNSDSQSSVNTASGSGKSTAVGEANTGNAKSLPALNSTRPSSRESGVSKKRPELGRLAPIDVVSHRSPASPVSQSSPSVAAASRKSHIL